MSKEKIIGYSPLFKCYVDIIKIRENNGLKIYHCNSIGETVDGDYLKDHLFTESELVSIVRGSVK